MTLKQRLAELLPHFDDGLQLLPNKVLTFKFEDSGWKSSDLTCLRSIVEHAKNGFEYRIESAPKRPREVWLSGDGKIVCACKTELAPFRFIEDTPREVTDEDAKRIWTIISKNGSVIGLENVKLGLQHYEQSRSE